MGLTSRNPSAYQSVEVAVVLPELQKFLEWLDQLDLGVLMGCMPAGSGMWVVVENQGGSITCQVRGNAKEQDCRCVERQLQTTRFTSAKPVHLQIENAAVTPPPDPHQDT